MAVKQSKPEPLIRNFWPRYHKRAIFTTIGVQLVISFGIIIVLMLNGVNIPPVVLIVLSVALIAATVGGNVLLVNLLLDPLRNLTAALTHISDEPNTVHPPNPNTPANQIDGFSKLLQEIYELSSEHDNDKDRPKEGNEGDLLSRAFEHSNASVIITDEQGTILYATPAAPIKTTSDGTKEIDLIFEDEVNFSLWLADSRKRFVHAKTTWQRISNRLVGESNRRIFDISVNYEKGNAAPVVLVLFDHTDIYKPEDDQLDFISFAAHELRGPVTVIRGYADVLTQELPHTGENSEALALLERLTVSANRLSGYINNILNASRYDRRHMRLHLTEQPLTAIYSSIADDMASRARTQNRLLSVDISPSLPTIAADVSSLSEVLSNLIDNAIKYSNEGGSVIVKAYVDGDMMRIDVVDQGIGMPANVISNLFHKFYRSHRSRETVAGTGIGLYICKAIIESHGGQIEVKSEEGRGSTFSVTVPIYSTVAEKLAASDNTNDNIIRLNDGGWIKNHAKFRG